MRNVPRVQSLKRNVVVVAGKRWLLICIIFMQPRGNCPRCSRVSGTVELGRIGGGRKGIRAELRLFLCRDVSIIGINLWIRLA